MMRPRYYIEVDGRPRESTVTEWQTMFEDFDRRWRTSDTLGNGIRISTVFLGLDHNFTVGGPPLLYETMAFDLDDKSIDMDRYSTREEAVIGHAQMCSKYS